MAISLLSEFPITNLTTQCRPWIGAISRPSRCPAGTGDGAGRPWLPIRPAAVNWEMRDYFALFCELKLLQKKPHLCALVATLLQIPGW